MMYMIEINKLLKDVEDKKITNDALFSQQE